MKLPHARAHHARSRLAFGFCSAASLAITAGCVGPAHLPIVGEPTGHPGFPAETQAENVRVEARFVENHARVLGRDLAANEGVIPIALRVGDRSGAGGRASLDAVVLDPVLFLEDGTSLPWVPLEELERDGDRVGSAALSFGLVPAWRESRPGFLFFSAAARGVRVRGRHALVLGQGLHRELDLLGAVVALTLSTPEGPRRLHVGLGLGGWEDR